ncbi:hypothetical protein ACI2L1_32335 [Streptomyces sp. NPDC019531]|uniref:hypothetical protein n=1 Tax=Streptomyces sp. NPDC019531 TaxID=3365062 RepID=UPI003850ECE6
MRRTARLRALSVVLPALGITLGVAAPNAFADPAAEVSPSSVTPGGSVTVSVSCDPDTGTPPATLDATSQAFDTETVLLQLVPGNDDGVSGPAYSGIARIAADQELQGGESGDGTDSAWTVDGTCPTADRAQGKAWSATFNVSNDSTYSTYSSGSSDTDSTGSTDSSGSSGSTGSTDTDSTYSTDSNGGTYSTDSTGSTESTESGGDRPCTEPHTEPRAEPPTTACDTAVIQRPVRAGQGGSFTDSVPALVTGGLLIAGAAAGAVYRLRRRAPAADV